MELSRKIIAIPAIALAGGLSLAACSSGGSSNGPALKPGSATASQMCQAQVGSQVQDSTTGAVTDTVKTATPGGNTYMSGSNELVSCQATLASSGTQESITVTLFPDGTTGWHS